MLGGTSWVSSSPAALNHGCICAAPGSWARRVGPCRLTRTRSRREGRGGRRRRGGERGIGARPRGGGLFRALTRWASPSRRSPGMPRRRGCPSGAQPGAAEADPDAGAEGEAGDQRADDGLFPSRRGGSIARGKVGKLAGCIVALETGDGSSAAGAASASGEVFTRAREAEDRPGRLGEEACAEGGGTKSGAVTLAGEGRRRGRAPPRWRSRSAAWGRARWRAQTTRRTPAVARCRGPQRARSRALAARARRRRPARRRPPILPRATSRRGPSAA